MSLLAYSPLAGGMLTGKYLGGATPADARFTLFDTFGLRYRKPMVREAMAAYATLARARGISLVQLALGYVKSRWFVGSTIIGATTMAQLVEDIAAAQFELDAETLAGDRRDPDALSQSGALKEDGASRSTWRGWRRESAERYFAASCARISPPGLAALCTFTYSLPAL